MECEKCGYHYIFEGTEEKEIFNGLLDRTQTIDLSKSYHMCGEKPQATFLDDNRPRCNKYKEVEDEG